ncbi:M14 metallopeptidase family protein [Flavobacterium sp. GT3R68]|uniref:M14 family metallopeptidase n=1 Tax=Flavobacterium sp. GT3R68 TaxID=2594437 RepID=UPI000F8650D5|nr:M14 metallopeptidase family protein [Flavobacterium sp. GT3R68]RTY86329.1 peptidase M14 [Flavobacterium sp. GSN2]TRW91559.1 peptidase M14 [Flavobacterium sp. GT3R68]
MNLSVLFNQYKEQSLFGRYITLLEIEPLINQYGKKTAVQNIGKSVLGKPIYQLELGTGKTKIFIWSQMHGNESTTTKALFDFLNLLNSNSEIAKTLLRKFTFCCLPIVNPDGATLYTRENANKVDLNRDSQTLTQPESQLLREVFERFKPQYCFNLHDQRTIFGLENNHNTATVSFLSPAYNEAREINDVRMKAINVISAMNDTLQQYIPQHIGRFEDSFNINCIGDTFQSLNTPTVLFEAGHFPEDYHREETRKYIFMALVAGCQFLSESESVSNRLLDYLNIPQNKVCFYDFVYKNVKINYDNTEIITNFAAQYKEELVDGQLCFNAYIVDIGDLEGFTGHYEYDAQKAMYWDGRQNVPQLGQKANFTLTNNVKIVNGLIKI